MIHPRQTRITAACSVSLALCALGLGGCSRAAEELKQKAIGAASQAVGDKVSEVVTEKVAEAALEKDGMKNAKVDIGQNGTIISGTDKDGKAFALAGGNAIHFSEADFGVPFYPGAKMDDSKTGKMESGESFSYAATMNSSDKFDKISAFYRDKLKAITGARRFMEMADGVGKITFMLMDEKQGSMIGVTIEAPEGEAATVTLIAQGKHAAAKTAP